ncbi:thioesterase II family protein [Enterobacter asburiae]|uniref:thioesterase II family protein n=1 Tax=Enterobacter asburiae TaxID=61645 RepID=UPI003B2775DA
MNEQPHIAMFHHAGGNAAALNVLEEKFSNFKVIKFEMPGRGRRRQAPLLTNVNQLTKDFFPQLPRHCPIIFMGHSLGAYIAYVMAKKYRSHDARQKILLVVIGNEPIHCRQFFDFTESSENSKDSLIKFANHLGQLPDWLQSEPVLLEQFLRVLSADLQVANSISEEESGTLDDIPVLALFGKEDPLFLSPPQRWQECTLQPFRLEEVPGGHFISEDQAHEISELTKHFIKENKIFNI